MPLEFSQIQIPGLAPDEVGYQITGTEQCASVRLMRAQGLAKTMFGFTASAFALDAQGMPTLTAEAGTIEEWHTITCAKVDLIVNGELSAEKVADLRHAATEQALLSLLAVTAAESAFDALGV